MTHVLPVLLSFLLSFVTGTPAATIGSPRHAVVLETPPAVPPKTPKRPKRKPRPVPEEVTWSWIKTRHS